MPVSSQSQNFTKTETSSELQRNSLAHGVSTRVIWVTVILSLVATLMILLPVKFHILATLFSLIAFFYAAPLIRAGFTQELHGEHGFRVVASAAIILTTLAAVLGAFSVQESLGLALAIGATVTTTLMLLVDHRIASIPKPKEAEQIVFPETAQRIERGVKKQVHVSALKIGNTLFVEHSNMIAADGAVLEGALLVDESMITGITGTVRKLPSSSVYAGSIVLEGRALCTVRAIQDDTMLARLARGRATGVPDTTKLHTYVTEKLVVLTGSTLAMMGAVIWAFSGWTPSFMGTATYGLAAAGATLVVTASLVAALRLAKREDPRHALLIAGVRVRDLDVLSRLRSADTIVFEKTGVLTTGALAVEHVVSFQPYTQQQVLNTAAAVEVSVDHIIAKTIVSFAKSHGAMSLQRTEGPVTDADGGLSAILNGKKVLVGSAAFMKRKKVKLPKDASLHAEEGHTVVFIASQKDAMGYVVLSDTPRAETQEVLAELRNHYRLVLLSGDHEESALALSKSLSMNEVIGDASAARKKEVLAQMRKEGKDVVLVSDTIRDADVSVRIVLANEKNALEALEQADVTIIGNDLMKLGVAFDTARRSAGTEARAHAWTIVGGTVLLPFAAVTGSVPFAALGSAVVVISALHSSKKRD